MRLFAALLCLGFSAPLVAQVQPRPVADDARIQVVDYDPDRVVTIQASQGYQVTLQFGSDERIENVAVGDSAAWQVTANNRGDLLFVKPIRDGVSTNLTVATDVRIYAFELSPSFGGDTPYMVRFRYPAPASPVPADPNLIANLDGRYRLSGRRALRPSRIGDDGNRTYITWPEDQLLPAVYTLDEAGRESLVNGYMRDGVYVIDTVLARLIFRIDQQVARATRLTPAGAP